MLNSLHIRNFRSLKEFQVPRLGRINLIVGKNNSGKSSILEALRIYAGNGNRELLEAIASEHDEPIHMAKEEINTSRSLPFDSFFSGRRFPDNDGEHISIGEIANEQSSIKIRHGFLTEHEETATDADGEIVSRIVRKPIPRQEVLEADPESISQALFISKGDKEYRLRFDQIINRVRISSSQEIATAIPCGVVPTKFVSTGDLADEWDKIVLTEYEETVSEALRLINNEFYGLAFVNIEEYTNGRNRKEKRIARIRLKSEAQPVPLNSMGDGMMRILQFVLKIHSARGGFLLIDEFENGLHYSIQSQVWRLIFNLSAQLDIQVFATTHSWDCIKSFSEVAIGLPEVEGVLFRVGVSVRNSDRGQTIATVFEEDSLENISQADMEVR